MSDDRQIAERFVQLAFDGDDPSPELIVQMTDEFLDAGLREAVEANQEIRDKCEQYWNESNIGTVEVHAILEFIHKRTFALAALKGEKA